MSERPFLEPSVTAGPEQLSTLLDCARELLAILSTEGIILHVNGGSTRVLGWRPDELVGRALTDFTHPDDEAVKKPFDFHSCKKRIVP